MGVGFLFLVMLCLGVSTLFVGYQLGWWGKKTPEVMVSPALGGENIFVEYIIDASGSMNDLLPDGVRKIDAARENLINSLKTYRPESSVGLRVYGHRIVYDNDQESCQDIELVAPVAPGYQGTIFPGLKIFKH